MTSVSSLRLWNGGRHLRDQKPAPAGQRKSSTVELPNDANESATDNTLEFSQSSPGLRPSRLRKMEQKEGGLGRRLDHKVTSGLAQRLSSVMHWQRRTSHHVCNATATVLPGPNMTLASATRTRTFGARR